MKKKTRTKPKIKTNKLNENPLFIKFLNWKGDTYTIELLLKRVKNSFKDENSNDFVQKRLSNLTDEYLNFLSEFQKKFKHYIVQTISTKNISEEFLYFLNNAFKYIEEAVDRYEQNEDRNIKIKDFKGRWFESLVCYNFLMTFNYFSVEIIKICPVCSSFFCHKGKYARYCSESCKELGMKKK